MSDIRGYLRTLDDINFQLWKFYDPEGNLFLEDRDLKLPEGLIKADAPVLTTTTGAWQARIAAGVWSQLNHEANAFAMLPKQSWEFSGVRGISARAGSLPYGGRSEGATIPDTIKPTLATWTAKPKFASSGWNMSAIQVFLSSKGIDDAISKEDMVGYMGMEHTEDINAQLLTDEDTLASNNFESLDRVAGSSVEATAGLITAADEDLYGVDRSANTWFNAYVNHNSGTDRNLTDAIIRTTMANVLINGAKNLDKQVWLTYPTQYTFVQGLYQDATRYTNVLKDFNVTMSVNGVSTDTGAGVGMRLASLYGIPLIQSKNVPLDTGGRMYLFDYSNQENRTEPRLLFRTARPTQYIETGLSTGQPWAPNFLGDEGLVYTMGEVIVNFPAVQAKIRDLN